MSTKRYFLGWDEPIVLKVAHWLSARCLSSSIADFTDTLIVVPTLQAGRRLREVLALRIHQQKAVALDVAIVTPHYFFATAKPDLQVANPALTMAVWASILKNVNTEEFDALLGNQQNKQAQEPWQQAFTTGRVIERLRRELAEAGCTLADVRSENQADLPEPERWQNLAELEKLYLERLQSLGYSDACRAKIALAQEPQLDAKIKNIIVAGVPDPSLLAVRAIKTLATKCSVDILVYAPESEQDMFDDWGRPIPRKWVESTLEFAPWEESVFLTAGPEKQSRKVTEIIAGLPAQYGEADIGIGVPDPSVTPFLQRDLKELQLPAFDPAEVSVDRHNVGRLIKCAVNLLRQPVYANLAAFLRHPDFLSYLVLEQGLNDSDLLRKLDEFQNFHLPAALDDMLGLLPEKQLIPPADDGYEELRAALLIVKKILDDFVSLAPEEAWRNFLQTVYSPLVVSNSAADKEFQQAAEAVEQTLRELRFVPFEELGLSEKEVLFSRRFRERVYYQERQNEVIDLQGWLELLWTDTPVLIITGMNEEFVPGGSLSDVFLPDSLRQKLGLRDDKLRFARDLYMLRAMQESRLSQGRLCLVLGKYTLKGDPLRPSRLLLQCGTEDLPSRARSLFRLVAQTDQIAAAEPIFKLKPEKAAIEKDFSPGGTVSVTALRDYLTCPFQFYLIHVLGMRKTEIHKVEMDALDFGILAHQVLNEMGRDKMLWACADEAQLTQSLIEILDRLAKRRFGAQMPPAVLVGLDALRARLRLTAQKQVALTASGWEIVNTEQTFKMKLKGFTLVGKIDRIDRNRHGEYRVIDYKTSDNASAPESEHLSRRRSDAPVYNVLKADGKTMQWTDLQLPLYSRLVDINLNVRAEPAYFTLGKTLADVGLLPWENFFEREDYMLSSLKCTEGILEAIARKVFYPPADFGKKQKDFADFFPDISGKSENVFDLTGFKR